MVSHSFLNSISPKYIRVFSKFSHTRLHQDFLRKEKAITPSLNALVLIFFQGALA